MNYISLKELCEELSISTATGRNWVKLGKIVPEYTEKRTKYFSETYVADLKKSIQSGENAALKSRRNKKYVSGNALYRAYVSETCKSVTAIQRLLQRIDEKQIAIEDEQLQILLADCGVKLFAQKLGMEQVEPENALLYFLEKKIDFGDNNRLLMDLIINEEKAKEWIQNNPILFQIQYEYEEREDIIGLLYISCKNIGNRKATGSYYTPTRVVRQLIGKLVEKNGVDKYVLDPCCGTGNFLLQLPEEFPLDKVYGNDIDTISVKVTRLNMALRFKNADIEVIYNNITSQNYLSEYEGVRFDYIVGNPPWGYSFNDTEKEYLRKHFASAIGKNIESYDVFIEKALSNLKKDGVLSFVLPEAILNVKSHMPIREIIADNNSIQYLGLLGDTFDKVQCPCIILQIQHTEKKISCVGMEVSDGSKTFRLDLERAVDPEYFSFTLTDDEYKIIRKINTLSNIVYLKDNAIFALGIVTGKNRDYISDKKTADNEMVLKGSDLCKYRAKKTDNYIVFKPDTFQQVAPIEYYRAPEKLLYRFISSQLVFAYDDKQTLSLNSCNILIPNISGLDMKYVLAILNSRVAQFVYKKLFHSVKVLRSHIEQIPIPKLPLEGQQEIIGFVELLKNEMPEEECNQVYERLDDRIRQLYGLNDMEYQTIKAAVDEDNKFLA